MSPLSMPARPGLAALPPIVAGPDNSVSHTICDQGYQLPDETGFGMHAGRGTPETSCYFAHTVSVA
jgi:serine/threonine-protein kinase